MQAWQVAQPRDALLLEDSHFCEPFSIGIHSTRAVRFPCRKRKIYMQSSILILGAGVSGLTAARFLQSHGLSVTLLDKGRGVGGRVSTRKLGDRDAPHGRWDHGAQFATFRSEGLKGLLQEWGVLEGLSSWSHSPDGTTRNRHPLGMNQFTRQLASGLQVVNSCRIVSLQQGQDGWTALDEAGNAFSAKMLISTLPAPQLIDLLRQSDLELPAVAALKQIVYSRCLTLMAELQGPSGIAAPGLLRPESAILEQVIDNRIKGISEAYTVTAHAKAEFSLEWFDRDRATAASVLRAALQEIVTSPILNVQIHGWKFAEAVRRHPEPCLELAPGFWAAGDGFCAGDASVPADHRPRIESAMLSGLLLAQKLRLML